MIDTETRHVNREKPAERSLHIRSAAGTHTTHKHHLHGYNYSAGNILFTTLVFFYETSCKATVLLTVLDTCVKNAVK